MGAVRYGIVGTGYFGAELGRALVALDDGVVTAVHDPEHGPRVAAELGAEAVGSAEELCARPDVDAVVVASPNWAHREPVLAAAAHGKHVFCEKPIALRHSDCAEMLRATGDAGVLFMAGHVTNFMAGILRTKAFIDQGLLGDVLMCRAVRTGWQDPQPTVSWKKRRELSGGHLYHHIHELDLVQSIMGPAQAATMVGGNVAHRGAEHGDEDDMLLITLELAGDRFAVLEYGSAFRWPEHHVLIQGTLGAARIDLQESAVEVRTAYGVERFGLHRTAEEDADRRADYTGHDTDGGIRFGAPDDRPPLWLRGIIADELDYFDGLVRGAAPAPEFAALTDGSAATSAIATADALTLSLREGRKVAVSEVVDPVAVEA
jgi:predicted dehydrogenase